MMLLEEPDPSPPSPFKRPRKPCAPPPPSPDRVAAALVPTVAFIYTEGRARAGWWLAGPVPYQKKARPIFLRLKNPRALPKSRRVRCRPPHGRHTPGPAWLCALTSIHRKPTKTPRLRHACGGSASPDPEPLRYRRSSLFHIG